MEFGVLLRLVGLMNYIFIVDCPINIQSARMRACVCVVRVNDREGEKTIVSGLSSHLYIKWTRPEARCLPLSESEDSEMLT